MMLSISCSLCLSPGFTFKCLLDDNGQFNNIYKIAIKYFETELPKSRECLSSTVICLKCWKHIDEFYKFQLLVRSALNTKKEFVPLLRSINHHINQVENKLNSVHKAIEPLEHECSGDIFKTCMRLKEINSESDKTTDIIEINSSPDHLTNETQIHQPNSELQSLQQSGHAQLMADVNEMPTNAWEICHLISKIPCQLKATKLANSTEPHETNLVIPSMNSTQENEDSTTIDDENLLKQINNLEPTAEKAAAKRPLAEKNHIQMLNHIIDNQLTDQVNSVTAQMDSTTLSLKNKDTPTLIEVNSLEQIDCLETTECVTSDHENVNTTCKFIRFVDRGFLCVICNISFTMYYNLTRHFRKRHQKFSLPTIKQLNKAKLNGNNNAISKQKINQETTEHDVLPKENGQVTLADKSHTQIPNHIIDNQQTDPANTDQANSVTAQMNSTTLCLKDTPTLIEVNSLEQIDCLETTADNHVSDNNKTHNSITIVKIPHNCKQNEKTETRRDEVLNPKLNIESTECVTSDHENVNTTCKFIRFVDRGFLCVICNISFTMYYNLTRHFRKRHQKFSLPTIKQLNKAKLNGNNNAISKQKINQESTEHDVLPKENGQVTLADKNHTQIPNHIIDNQQTDPADTDQANSVTAQMNSTTLCRKDTPTLIEVNSLEQIDCLETTEDNHVSDNNKTHNSITIVKIPHNCKQNEKTDTRRDEVLNPKLNIESTECVTPDHENVNTTCKFIRFVDRGFLCVICNISFTMYYNLTRHFRKRHQKFSLPTIKQLNKAKLNGNNNAISKQKINQESTDHDVLAKENGQVTLAEKNHMTCEIQMQNQTIDNQQNEPPNGPDQTNSVTKQINSKISSLQNVDTTLLVEDNSLEQSIFLQLVEENGEVLPPPDKNEKDNSTTIVNISYNCEQNESCKNSDVLNHKLNSELSTECVNVLTSNNLPVENPENCEILMQNRQIGLFVAVPDKNKFICKICKHLTFSKYYNLKRHFKSRHQIFKLPTLRRIKKAKLNKYNATSNKKINTLSTSLQLSEHVQPKVDYQQTNSTDSDQANSVTILINSKLSQENIDSASIVEDNSLEQEIFIELIEENNSSKSFEIQMQNQKIKDKQQTDSADTYQTNSIITQMDSTPPCLENKDTPTILVNQVNSLKPTNYSESTKDVNVLDNNKTHNSITSGNHSLNQKLNPESIVCVTENNNKDVNVTFNNLSNENHVLTSSETSKENQTISAETDQANFVIRKMNKEIETRITNKKAAHCNSNKPKIESNNTNKSRTETCNDHVDKVIAFANLSEQVELLSNNKDEEFGSNACNLSEASDYKDDELEPFIIDKKNKTLYRTKLEKVKSQSESKSLQILANENRNYTLRKRGHQISKVSSKYSKKQARAKSNSIELEPNITNKKAEQHKFSNFSRRYQRYKQRQRAYKNCDGQSICSEQSIPCKETVSIRNKPLLRSENVSKNTNCFEASTTIEVDLGEKMRSIETAEHSEELININVIDSNRNNKDPLNIKDQSLEIKIDNKAQLESRCSKMYQKTNRQQSGSRGKVNEDAKYNLRCMKNRTRNGNNSNNKRNKIKITKLKTTTTAIESELRNKPIQTRSKIANSTKAVEGTGSDSTTIESNLHKAANVTLPIESNLATAITTDSFFSRTLSLLQLFQQPEIAINTIITNYSATKKPLISNKLQLEESLSNKNNTFQTSDIIQKDPGLIINSVISSAHPINSNNIAASKDQSSMKFSKIRNPSILRKLLTLRKCYYCSKIFKYPNNLQKHIKIFHCNIETPQNDFNLSQIKDNTNRVKEPENVSVSTLANIKQENNTESCNGFTDDNENLSTTANAILLPTLDIIDIKPDIEV